jgi:tetratricopeptide (TPR) repeat protein
MVEENQTSDPMSLLQSGRGQEAFALMQAQLEQTENEFGKKHAAWAAVSFEAAQLHAANQDYKEARMLLEQACGVVSTDEGSKRARLSYLLSLGELCLFMGDLATSTAHLEESLAGREVSFGADHPATAFGLEAMADLHLGKREVELAFERIEKARTILQAHSHPRLAGVLVLRAHVLKAKGGLSVDGFAGLGDVSDDQWDEIVMESIVRAEASHPDLSLAVLQELLHATEIRRGIEDQAIPHLAAAVTRVAAEAQEGAARVEAYKQMVRHFEARTEVDQLCDAQQALALALNEIGRHVDAESAYGDAIKTARGADATQKLAQLLRDYGLFFSSMRRRDEARPHLEEAVSVSRQCGEPLLLGRALVALGILNHQCGENDSATACLEEGLSLLPDDHGDCLFAERHLRAIRAGEHLDANSSDSVSQTLLAMVGPRLPEGLLNDIRVGVDPEGALDVQLDLAREPTPAEASSLETVVNEALGALGETIKRGGA